MSKERLSATVDPDVQEFLDMPGRNKSETINEAVKQYMKANSSDKAMLRLRKEQLESDISNLKSQLREKENELNRVDEKLGEHKSETEQVITDAREKFAGHELDPEDPAVRNYASKADLPVSEFIERVQE